MVLFVLLCGTVDFAFLNLTYVWHYALCWCVDVIYDDVIVNLPGDLPGFRIGMQRAIFQIFGIMMSDCTYRKIE